MSVLEKINRIMNEVKFIKKDGKIEFGKTKYNFIEDDDVVAEIRKQMIELKMVMYPKDSNSEVKVYGSPGQEKFLTITKQTFVIADTEDGSQIEVTTVGQGADSADKGSGKSATNSRKYALLQTFMLTGDDPDKVASDQYNQKPAQQTNSQPAKPAENKPTPNNMTLEQASEVVCQTGYGKGAKFADLTETQLKYLIAKGTDLEKVAAKLVLDNK